MYTTIIARAALDQIDRTLIKGCTLYVVREEATIFYVGRSVDPLERLQEHFGKTKRSPLPSDLGRFLLDNAPQSGGWAYELLTPEECREYINKLRLSNPSLSEWDEPPTNDIGWAEMSLIGHLHPCLNVIYNQEPTPIPEKYHFKDNAPVIEYPKGWSIYEQVEKEGLNLYIVIAQLFNEKTQQLEVDYDFAIAERASDVKTIVSMRLQRRHPGFILKSTQMEVVSPNRLFVPIRNDARRSHFRIVIEEIGQ